MKPAIAVAGAGFSGAVIARELAERGYRIEVFEERAHVAGNCHTARDSSTGVMVHKYGPHIFHTDRSDVWRYVNQHGIWKPFTNRVKAYTARGVFSLPINLLTINQFFGVSFCPAKAQAFIEMLGDEKIRDPQNFEEQALKMMGQALYNNFFRGYTRKQWGVDPRELPASILKRLPMRFTYDDNYYSSRYQAIPSNGYTEIVQSILNHDGIRVNRAHPLTPAMAREYAHTFWSGPLDAYFGYELGRLEYRTLEFERFEEWGDHQGTAVMNYCEESVPFTRVAEHKHFAPWELHEKTVCFREYSRRTEPGDTPYYPVRLAADKALLAKYVSLAEHREKNITFIGRLGTYRYLDMDGVIGEALDLAHLLRYIPMEQWPRFSANPL